MQRHQRQSSIKATAVKATAVNAIDRRARGTLRRRRAISLSAVLLTLVIVVLLTVAVASTVVAVRATKQRTRAQDDLAKASQAIDESVLTAATHKDLKGLKMEPVRKDLLQNALAFYQDYVTAHALDQPPSPQVAAAHFHIAAIQAKLGSMKSVPAFNQAVIYLDKMKAAKVDPESYPSVQQCAMKVAAPKEWMVIKGASFSDLPKHGLLLFVALQGAALSYDALCKEYPQAVSPRDNLSAIVGAMAMLQSSVGNRSTQALAAWLRARDLLDTLVRDQPDNIDYQVRLAESLVGAAKLEKNAKNNDAAAKLYQRAVEVREKLAAAKPDDKELAQELATAQKELAKIKPAEPNEPAAEKAEAAAPAASTEKESPVAALADTAAPADKVPAPAAADDKAPAPADPPAAAP